MSFKHYIITRFNLSRKWNQDNFGNKVLDATWLKKRFQLFEDYCFPSVKNQTNKNFEWWVFFDEETPEYYHQKIKDLQETFPNFKPKFKASYQEFQDTLSIDLFEDVKTLNHDFVITTRLDNDDIISNKMAAMLQKNTVHYKAILEGPVGYNLKLGKINRLKKMNYPLSPFISLLEKIENNKPLETVYALQHGEWTKEPRVVISRKPLWIQVIHENNVSNQEKGKDIITYGALKDFTFKKPKFRTQDNIKLIKKEIKKSIRRMINS